MVMYIFSYIIIIMLCGTNFDEGKLTKFLASCHNFPYQIFLLAIADVALAALLIVPILIFYSYS